MSIQFITDSGSDITPREAAALGIRLVPLKVIFGNEEFSDGVDLTIREFYDRLIESDTLPTTCQAAPADFEAALEQVTAAGDAAVIVTLSGRLSGTCQSAMIAAQDYPGAVVVDSESVSLGQRILILHGLALAKQGKTAPEIKKALDAQKKKLRVLALLDTLEYLKRGGRISAATALAGSLLSIKPVVTVEQGEVAMAGKARGSRQGNNLLRQLVERCGGIDFELPYCLAYSGQSDLLLQKYIQDSAELWQGHTDHLPIAQVGSVIGTHVGPGVVAVAFFEK